MSEIAELPHARVALRLTGTSMRTTDMLAALDGLTGYTGEAGDAVAARD